MDSGQPIQAVEGVVAQLAPRLGFPPTPGAHLGIATDRGLPSLNIRFKTLHASNASVACASA